MQTIVSDTACKQAACGRMAHLLAVAGSICAWAGDAAAYIDPATGSLAMQMLLGAVFGALATVRLWFGKVKALVMRCLHRDKE